MTPFISIVIPAKNAQATMRRCLDSVLRLNYPNFEIIVINDGSNDNTASILIDYKDLEIINTKGIGPSAARNLALRKARGELIAFTDADCLVDRDWLKELRRGFEDFPEAAACGGRQELPSDATEFEKKIFLFMKKVGFITDYMRRARGERIVEVNHNASCCVMYRKDIFLKEKGFLEGLWPGEDVELDYRLKKKGYKIYFNPKAIVYHYRPKNLKKFLKMMYRYGWAQGFLVRKYGVFRRIQLLLIIFIIFGLLLITLWMFYDNKITSLLIIILILETLLYFSFNLILLFLGLTGIFFWHTGFIKGFINSKH